MRRIHTGRTQHTKQHAATHSNTQQSIAIGSTNHQQLLTSTSLHLQLTGLPEPNVNKQCKETITMAATVLTAKTATANK